MPGALSDEEFLHELAGVTGVGWTASTLGFLGSLLWYGGDPVSAQPVGSRLLLYLGIGCFLATVVLDALGAVLVDANE